MKENLSVWRDEGVLQLGLSWALNVIRDQLHIWKQNSNSKTREVPVVFALTWNDTNFCCFLAAITWCFIKTFQGNLLQIKSIFFHSLNSFHIALTLPSGLWFRVSIIAFRAAKARWIAIQFNLAHRDAFTVISSKHDVDIEGQLVKKRWLIKFIHLLSSSLMWTFLFQLTAVKIIKKNKTHTQLDECLCAAE